MWIDEIVEEVRQSRAAHAERCGNNLEAIIADLQQQQRRSGRTVVSFESKRDTKQDIENTVHE